MVHLSALAVSILVLVAEIIITLIAYLLVRGIACHTVALLANDECYHQTIEHNTIGLFDIVGVICISLLGMGWARSVQVPTWCFTGSLDHLRRAVAYIVEPLTHALCAIGVYLIMLAGWSVSGASYLFGAAALFQQYATLEQGGLLTQHMADRGALFYVGLLMGVWCFTHMMLCILTSIARLVNLILLAIWGDQESPHDVALVVYIVMFGLLARLIGPFMMRGLFHLLEAVARIWSSGILA